MGLLTGTAKTEATKGRASRMEVNRIVLNYCCLVWSSCFGSELLLCEVRWK